MNHGEFPLNTKVIDYVLCAAGLGTRFKSLVPNTPKPLIKINGISLLERSLLSLDFQHNDRLIIIVQKKDLIEEKLSAKLKALFPFLKIIWMKIDFLTKGQLDTFYLAKKHLRIKKASTVIFNCDTFFKSPELSGFISNPLIDCIIPCAKAAGNEWSFCKIDRYFTVVDIQEKIRISPWASVGYYFFRDTELLLKLTKENLNKKTNREQYVAPLYQEYTKLKKNIKVVKAEVFLPMGTPEQISVFWKIKPKAIALENYAKTIVIDLDDTITINSSHHNYLNKTPNKKILTKLREYKKMGYKIIIHTARNMKTQNNDESKVVANIGDITIQWLKKHKVPFDGLKFGKPFAENGFYVDDKSIRPNEFINLSEDDILKLIDGDHE